MLSHAAANGSGNMCMRAEFACAFQRHKQFPRQDHKRTRLIHRQPFCRAAW